MCIYIYIDICRYKCTQKDGWCVGECWFLCVCYVDRLRLLTLHSLHSVSVIAVVYVFLLLLLCIWSVAEWVSVCVCLFIFCLYIYRLNCRCARHITTCACVFYSTHSSFRSGWYDSTRLVRIIMIITKENNVLMITHCWLKRDYSYNN